MNDWHLEDLQTQDLEEQLKNLIFNETKVLCKTLKKIKNKISEHGYCENCIGAGCYRCD
ncbi:MAG TPA: hypothetical protein VN855_00510 [Candidatus Acidoferrum sp.]|nr:hypothetical protein [Candidatus Acidoferrum sp.]